MNLKLILNVIRFKNYLKNLVIFLPLFLNNTSWTTENYLNLFVIFIFFSFLASSIYILNDIFDLEEDKKHSIKKSRPIASGKISVQLGLIISIFFAILSFVYFYFFTSIEILLIVTIYYLINFFYSSYIKKIKYFDLLIVSLGFLIRIYLVH